MACDWQQILWNSAHYNYIKMNQTPTLFSANSSSIHFISVAYMSEMISGQFWKEHFSFSKPNYTCNRCHVHCVPSTAQTTSIYSPTAFPCNSSLYRHPLQTALMLKWGGGIVGNSNKEWITEPGQQPSQFVDKLLQEKCSSHRGRLLPMVVSVVVILASLL